MPHPTGRKTQNSTRNNLIAGLIFFAALVGGAATIRTLIDDPIKLYAEYRSEKLKILTQHSEDTNLATFGSSHIHLGFDPRAFDKSLGDSRIRSLNLAVQGGSHVEQKEMALAFLNANRKIANKRCILLLELNAGVNFQNYVIAHPRAINAYSADNIKLVMAFADKSIDVTRRLGRIGYALVAGFMHYSNVGMLSSKIFTPALNLKELKEQTIGDRRGLASPPLNPKETVEVVSFLTQTRRSAKRNKAATSAGLAHLVQEIEAAPKTCAPEVFYVVSPKLSDLEQPVAYPESILVGKRPVPILNLADPARYPEIYRPKMWRDVAHLSEEGAGLTSKVLADAMKPYLATD